MKKSLILTSILALAACGGGHHGGGIDTPVVPDTGKRVSDHTISSNQKITSMYSEILVPKAGIGTNIARSASVIDNGTEYIAYHLDDVTFTMSEITDTSDLDLIKIETNPETGEINGIKMSHKGKWGDIIKRDGEKKVFNGSDETIEVDLLGNLKYSDFGFVRVTDLEEGDVWNTALAGGYKHFNVEKDKMSGEMVFKGRAVGGVSRENGGYDDDGELVATKKLDTGENGATLTFNNGSENLEMNFTDWYKVTVSKDADKDTANIKFDADGKTIADDLKFQHTEYADFNEKTYGIGENGIIGRYETTFYGENNNATETTGIVSVRETTGIDGNNTDNVSELSFSSAFGGKK